MEHQQSFSRYSTEIRALCREISRTLATVQSRMAADRSFVFSDEYRHMKQALRVRQDELRALKAKRAESMHFYSLILNGDVSRDGTVLENCAVNYELSTMIDCKLGDNTALNRTEGSHNALWNVLIARFSRLFVNSRFTVRYIVQLK